MAELDLRPIEFKGSCLCGGVCFTGQGLRDIVYCHCRQCRFGHGAIAAYSATEFSKLTLTKQDTLRWYSASPVARRGFCIKCGGNLFWESVAATTVSIAAGALDQTVGLQGAGHIYVKDKAPYYEISDHLPQFPGNMYVQE